MKTNEHSPESKDNPHARWVNYRPDIKILDCTIRDGGLLNEHRFDDSFAKAVFDACAAAGVDYLELGYKASRRIFASDRFGKWKFCDEDDIRRLFGENTSGMKLTVMADADRTDYHTDILPREKSVIDCIRVACYIHQVPMAMDMVRDFHEKGYETMIQLMAVSTVSESDVLEALNTFAQTPASAVYIVDSFGSLYSEQVRDLTRLYLRAMDGTGKEVGFHAHNNQQLAFANTIEAVVSGANRVDATINGIGRGAGNCPLELLIGFLHNPKFRVRPILECCSKTMVPLARDLRWGYSLPFAITGKLNRHPGPAIEMLESQKPEDYAEFYDRMTEQA